MSLSFPIGTTESGRQMLAFMISFALVSATSGCDARSRLFRVLKGRCAVKMKQVLPLPALAPSASAFLTVDSVFHAQTANSWTSSAGSPT
jgi:hypothetical protein